MIENNEISFTTFSGTNSTRNLFKEFGAYYEVKHKTDPESYPMDLNESEWWVEFSIFIGRQ